MGVRPRRFGSLLLFATPVALLAVLTVLAGAAIPLHTPVQETGRPKLAVLVVFDQMRGDYLERWSSLFGEDGFRRVFREGAWFRNCHYPYAVTVTGAGHASLGTGACPDTHGIIANDWYDRLAGESVYCATSRRYATVPSPALRVGYAEPPGTAKPSSLLAPTAGTPERLEAPTLAEALKQATGGQARVVSVSFKDRAAILMAGRGADVACWLDTETGSFVTSTYYAGRLPAWVGEFNEKRPCERWFGEVWTRLREDVDYCRYCDCLQPSSGGTGTKQGKVFPHLMNAGRSQPSKEYYQALYNSPFGNEVTLALAEKAIEAEHLGRHEVPDLLCVSFSCNDPIGHCWGPDSQEVMDVTLRSDLVLARLLKQLDQRVGVGKYVLALSADHGVCPLPEVARRQGHEAGRVPGDVLARKAEGFLQTTFGRPGAGATRWIEAVSPPWIYFNQRLLGTQGVSPTTMQTALADWLSRQPGVAGAYTRNQLSVGPLGDDPIGESIRRSFQPQRSGDVYLLLKPFHLLSTELGTGTSHGTPYAYDTHVPLLVYGPGVRAGARDDRVAPQAATTILARSLGIRPPESAEYAVPAGLLPGATARSVVFQTLPGLVPERGEQASARGEMNADDRLAHLVSSTFSPANP